VSDAAAPDLAQRDAARDRAADAAVELVKDGMTVGLGTGDTAGRFIDRLARHASERKWKLTCAATSEASVARARAGGLNVRPLGEFARFDLAVDGADEVDPNLDLVKGGGGAHTKEKIVAAAAARFVVVVDQTKLVDALGDRCPVPLEVVPDAVEFVMARLVAQGAKVVLRSAEPAKGKKKEAGAAYVTELGNRILDARFGRIEDAEALARQLDAVPGVVEHGLFLGMASLVLVGEFTSERVKKLARLARPARPAR